MHQRLRHILVCMLLGLLFLPMLQQWWGLIEEKPLEGISKTYPKPLFSLSKWMEGTYQDSVLNYVSKHCGFHNSLIRLNNQYYYAVYATAQANGVIVGQSHALYDPTFIAAYTGTDFLGEDSIRAHMKRLVEFQKLLQIQGKFTLLVIVPGKATGLPEFLPKGTPPEGEHTNYKSFKRLADSLQFPFLDLIAWYRQQKDTSQYPLYPPGGIHWSQYCATLAADTLMGFISDLTKTELNRLTVTGVDWEPAKGEDNDINRGMNLLFPLPAPQMAYPRYTWKGIPPRFKILSIADSYYFRTFSSFTLPVFEASHQWFYFRELHFCGEKKNLPTEEVDLLQEVESQDIVMIFTSDRNLTDFGFGFIEKALPLLREAAVHRIIDEICLYDGWMQQMVDKATAEDVALDVVLRRDATWLLNEKLFGNL